MKRLIKDNRGAALVTAVITIMFIAILGTTLLSVSYSNLIMKKNNTRAKDNLYTAEMAMGELQSVLRSQSDKTAVVNLLHDTSKVNTTTKTFNASQFYPMAFGEANSADDSITVTYGAISETPDSIVISDVTASSIVDGFESKVTTDIVITYSSGGRYNLDINDFSILSDQDFSLYDPSQPRATNGHIYGYLYCGKQSGSSAAMTIGDTSTINIISEAAIINGDLVVRDNATLHILGGTCIVTGNIKVEGNATLIVSSDCKVSGTATGRIIGRNNITTNTGININSALNNGTVTKGLFRDVEITDASGGNRVTVNVGTSLAQQNKQYKVDTNLGGQQYHAYLFQERHNEGNAFNDLKNTLFLTNAKIQIQSGDYVNSTIVTTGRVVMAVQKQYVTTQLATDKYEALRQLVVPAITPASKNEIPNPKVAATGQPLKFDDLLYPRDVTSNFLSNLFNVANPGGGSKKANVTLTNWRINDYD